MDKFDYKTDAQLVLEYARTRSDTAFAEIVRRHINTVYAAACRQLHDSAMAEDVTQAVFIVLSKRAARIQNPHLLVGWLLHVARFCAADARKIAARRRHHEQKAAAVRTMIEPPAVAASEITEHLDAHLAALGSVDRTAVILRCLEERSLAEVARELEISEEAAKKRVGRALEKLRQAFGKKAVSASTAVLAVALAKQSLAAPPTLAGTICTAAAAKTASTTTAALITKGALKVMAWTTAKITLAAAAGVVVVAAGTTEVVRVAAFAQASSPAPSIATSPAGTSPDSQPAQYVYIMGKVRRPGVWQIAPNLQTVSQILRRANLNADVRADGWLRIIRRVAEKEEHRVTIYIPDILSGASPDGIREIRGNDVINVGVAPPDFSPAEEPRNPGMIAIIGKVPNAGSYEIFGQYLSLTDVLTRFAGASTDQLADLVVSVGQHKDAHAVEFFAQYKLSDIAAGKSETYHPKPGETLLVQTSATAMPAKYIVPLPKSGASLPIVPADRPSVPGDHATYAMEGDFPRRGEYVLDGHKITIKMAIAAVSFDAANSVTATLHRRMENGTEKVIEVNLKAIFDGTEPDRFCRAAM